MASAPIVSYHSVALYPEDVALLEPTQWLNDAVLTFGIERLEHNLFSSRPDLAFLHPSLSMILLLEDDEDDLAATLKGLKLQEKQFLFVPINDSADAEKVAAGSHWTLLVMKIGRDEAGITSCEAVHLDSANPGGKRSGNHAIATSVANRITCYLFSSTSSPSASSRPTTTVTLASASCAKQQNGYDCGVYVLWFMEKVAAAITSSSAASAGDFQAFVEAAVQTTSGGAGSAGTSSATALTITAYRQQLLQTIHALLSAAPVKTTVTEA